jgi:hypothetical protein
MNYQIIAADTIIDGVGDHSRTNALIAKANKRHLKITTLEIAPLSVPWDAKLSANHFKSGASAMAAVKKARELLSKNKSDLVIIKGSDFLRTGYSKEDREKSMKLYKKRYSPLDGYNKLVTPFIRQHGINESDFLHISKALFNNYSKTWLKLHPKNKLPNERWFEHITKFFRGVDCANPNIDYSGQLVITNTDIADFLKVPNKERVNILGNAFTKLSVDGFESIPVIAPYLHLKRTINEAMKETNIDFKTEMLNGRALLEAYTCYPVVPMALLLKLGLVKDLKDIPEFLEQHEVTITGGLNLAKAPWNLTSLNGLIAMRDKILSSKKIKVGLVHGNGSLGNQQGITILGKY